MPPDEVTQSELDVLSGDESTTDNVEEVSSEEEGSGTSESEGETTREGEGEETSEEEGSEESEGEEEEKGEESTEEQDLAEELTDAELAAQEAQITRPSWKLIKEKYPELTKDKDFRAMYFRDKAFTEIYPTVSEAKSAQEKAESFDFVDSKLASGDTISLLQRLNEPTVKQLATNILPSLFKVNKELFEVATKPVIIDMLHEIQDYAIKSKDENLRKSIRNVSAYLTGSPELPNRPAPVTSPEIEREKEKLAQEKRESFLKNQREFLTATDFVIAKKINKLIEDGLGNPKGLNDFARKAVIERTAADIRKIMIGDDPLNKRIMSLHILAAKGGFTMEHRARIISALLERAKGIIPQVRAKHVTAALGKQLPKDNGKERIVAKAGERKGTSETDSKGPISIKQIDTKKTSPEDFLAGKVTYRR